MTKKSFRYKAPSTFFGALGGIFGAIFLGAVILYTPITWVVNLVELISCDFDNNGSWKGEIIHGVGLIPPVAWFTAWDTTSK